MGIKLTNCKQLRQLIEDSGAKAERGNLGTKRAYAAAGDVVMIDESSQNPAKDQID